VQVLHPICCGLDVHKKLVVACLRVQGADGRARTEVRRFEAMTDALGELAAWLVGAGCTLAVVESTGPYRKPLYNLLEERDGLAVWVVNARHARAVPGRKTDQNDACWLAELGAHGLVRPSFVPDRAQRELRELVRYRTSLLRERAAEVNRLQKVLEGANIKLAGVVSDVMGVSARAMLAELVAGATDAAALAGLAVGQLKAKRALLERALTGVVGDHQRFVLAEQLGHIDELDARVGRLDAEVARRMAAPDAATGERPFEDAVRRLDTIPGVGRRTAEAIAAEVGVAMDRFPSARHLASWAGMCPGQDESAGKRRSGKTRPGSPFLRAALAEAAWAAGRTKDTHLGAQMRRLAARRGKKRAVVAVGHSILVIAYHLLRDRTVYAELGSAYVERRDPAALQRRLVRGLERLGLKVTVEPLTQTEAA
jgi:transposase